MPAGRYPGAQAVARRRTRTAPQGGPRGMPSRALPVAGQIDRTAPAAQRRYARRIGPPLVHAAVRPPDRVPVCPVQIGHLVQELGGADLRIVETVLVGVEEQVGELARLRASLGSEVELEPPRR